MEQNEAKKLRTLNTFAIELITIPNAGDLFWYVARNVVGRLGFQDCVIYQANQEQSHLSQVAALGEKNPMGQVIDNPLTIPFGKGITGKVAQTGQEIVIKDLKETTNYIEDAQPARSEICVPMLCGNQVVGVIDSEHPNVDAFSPEDLEILITVAAMCGAKLRLLEEARKSKENYAIMARAHQNLAEERTVRKELENKLQQAQRLEATARLAGGIAHDFNNFLTVISANLETLELTVKKPSEKECIKDALAATKRGAKTTKNLMSFARRAWLSPEVFDLNKMVHNFLDWNKKTLHESITVRLNLAPDLPTIKADVLATETALLNLVINAGDAMPDGGTLEITTKAITLNQNDIQKLMDSPIPGDYVCLSVQDNGIGIPDKLMSTIFEMFYSSKNAGEGAGVGLSMIHGFMQQSGGIVHATSELGTGSTFSLYFPIHVEN